MRALTVASPSLGWNTRDPVAGMKPGFASILDNYIIEGGVPRVRPGYRVWATGMPGRVDGLLPWSGAGTTEQLFAASGAGIYDVTAGGAVGSAVVSGLTSARWSSLMFAAAGGNFMFCFNGADTSQTFNGTTWANWTGTGVTGGVAWANQFQTRLFVGNPGRLSFFYGGAGAIAGSFTEFPLQGVSGRGGGVCAMATISGDGGTGAQDLAVFITTTGDAIVYAGTDPSSASTWELVGRWRIARPLGAPHRCVVGYGGDALLLTEAGVVPLSALRSGEDLGTVLDRVGPVRRIEPTWQALAVDRGTLSGWGITPLTRGNTIIINVPFGPSAAQQVVVSEGGAVSRWNGIQAAVWVEAMGSRVFCGDAAATGRVLLWGENVSDAGGGIWSEALTAYVIGGAGARVKRAQLAQPVMTDAAGVQQTIEVLSNWRIPQSEVDARGPSAPAPALPALNDGGAFMVWDVGLWDVGLWAGASQNVTLPWRGVRGLGYALAVRLSMLSGNGRPAWLGTNLVVDQGNTVR
jgi:hypothetical protein